MARFFAFNSLAGCSRSSSSVVEVTTASSFDTTYVGNGITVPNGADYFETPPFMDGSASTTTLWLRMDLQKGTGSFGQDWLYFYNSTGTIVVKVTTGGSGLQAQFWNGATYTSGPAAVAFGAGTLKTMVFKLVCGASGSLDVYLGGSVIYSMSITSASTNNVAKVRIMAANNNSFPTIYSQIMGADYDIRDAHLQTATLNGNSVTNTAGTGSYTDIDETVLDDADSVTISSAGKKGQTKSSLTIPGSFAIVGMVINARGRINGGVITQGKLGVRSSGVESASSDRAFTTSYEPRGAMFDVDPNTSIAFSQAGFNSAEIFEQAV